MLVALRATNPHTWFRTYTTALHSFLYQHPAPDTRNLYRRKKPDASLPQFFLVFFYCSSATGRVRRSAASSGAHRMSNESTKSLQGGKDRSASTAAHANRTRGTSSQKNNRPHTGKEATEAYQECQNNARRRRSSVQGLCAPTIFTLCKWICYP